jgi:AcrR family transcriptional regulator
MGLDQAKQSAILNAAVKQFGRFGLRKASIDSIAQKAGVAKGTVYLMSVSKEDLFYQAVHREVRAWSAEIAKSIDPRTRADELLLTCAVTADKYLRERPLVKQLLFGAVQSMLPGWQHEVEQLRELGRRNITEILNLGIGQKIFRDTIDVELVSQIIQDFEINMYAYHDRVHRGGGDLMRRLAAGIDLLMNGLVK